MVNVAIAVDDVFTQLFLGLSRYVRYFKRELLYFGGVVVKNNEVQTMIRKGEWAVYEGSRYVFSWLEFLFSFMKGEGYITMIAVWNPSASIANHIGSIASSILK